MRPSRFLSALAAAVVLTAGTLAADDATTITAPLKSEKVASAPENPPRAFDSIRLERRPSGKFSVALLPEDKTLTLPEVDLRLLVPRAPALALGNADLTKIALIQREFNRNEVHHDIPGGLDFSIANNCLRQGLWEVKLGAKGGGKAVAIYHGWFDFPKAAYAALFEEVNKTPYAGWDALFSNYPKLTGLPVPLGALRRIDSEATLAPIDLHAGAPLQRLPEQQSKTKHLLTPEIARYGDFAAAGRQPISTSRFSEPGFYNPEDPMKFDLGWLAHPSRVVARKASPVSGGAPFVEIEIDFENGNRVLFADRRIGSLAARNEVPSAENDVLKIVSGIGTPTIHATSSERADELSEDRPRYLFLLDAQNVLLDNHFGGMDGIYLWREAGTPGSLHIWLVGYERIAFAAHFSTPWIW